HDSLPVRIFKEMKYAIVDIETTGGNAFTDRMTEIAIYIHDGEKIVDEFSSLINPERPIPPYVARLTGISDEMVSVAPKFYEVAKEIVRVTEGCIFVAHNVQFDYQFVRYEFKSLGYDYNRDHLCTVRLSRKLLPGHPSYSLGRLCEGLGIHLENRHRAGGDALATVRLFELLLASDKDEWMLRTLRNDHVHLRFPPEFDQRIIDRLPERHGVYYFHNEDGSVIYVGKSNNIRKRVLSHFANKQGRKAIELRNAIRDITFEVTGNELIALLLESDEIKRLQPLFNRAQRRTLFNYGVLLDKEADYLRLKPSKIRMSDEPIAIAASMEDARNLLERLVKKHGLCQKLCGLYPVVHACFHYSIGQCDGACVGKVSQEEYNERVMKAIEGLQYSHENFLIVGNGRNLSERSIVQVHNGKYVGFGYADETVEGQGLEALLEVIHPRIDTRDTRRILRHFLTENKAGRVIPYTN
ncbi:MAG: exonuclease domain-containing protein, partial [Bacteroidota bacterium]